MTVELTVEMFGKESLFCLVKDQKMNITIILYIVNKLYLPSGRVEFLDGALVVLKLLKFSSETSSDEGGSKKSVGSLPQNEPNNTLGHTLEILK